MAGVENAKRALWTLFRSLKNGDSAKLVVTTERGNLKVNLQQSFAANNNGNNSKTPKSAKKRSGPSRRRRKALRAADPAVQHRAAGHVSKPGADLEASSEEGEYSEYRSPEKDRANATSNPDLQISPEKVVVREEVEEVSETAAEKSVQDTLESKILLTPPPSPFGTCPKIHSFW